MPRRDHALRAAIFAATALACASCSHPAEVVVELSVRVLSLDGATGEQVDSKLVAHASESPEHYYELTEAAIAGAPDEWIAGIGFHTCEEGSSDIVASNLRFCSSNDDFGDLAEPSMRLLSASGSTASIIASQGASATLATVTASGGSYIVLQEIPDTPDSIAHLGTGFAWIERIDGISGIRFATPKLSPLHLSPMDNPSSDAVLSFSAGSYYAYFRSAALVNADGSLAMRHCMARLYPDGRVDEAVELSVPDGWQEAKALPVTGGAWLAKPGTIAFAGVDGSFASAPCPVGTRLTALGVADVIAWNYTTVSVYSIVGGTITSRWTWMTGTSAMGTRQRIQAVAGGNAVRVVLDESRVAFRIVSPVW
jgi:hypothetical protein